MDLDVVLELLCVLYAEVLMSEMMWDDKFDDAEQSNWGYLSKIAGC